MRDLYTRYGYQEVITPQIFSTDLWKRSGHYDNYLREHVLHPGRGPRARRQADELPRPLRACTRAQVHSYRELPLRYADFGRLHRFERSGTLHGLTRVRSFSQDDAHIYCTLDQVGGRDLRR